jgi:hypothetical protein
LARMHKSHMGHMSASDLRRLSDLLSRVRSSG